MCIGRRLFVSWTGSHGWHTFIWDLGNSCGIFSINLLLFNLSRKEPTHFECVTTHLTRKRVQNIRKSKSSPKLFGIPVLCGLCVTSVHLILFVPSLLRNNSSTKSPIRRKAFAKHGEGRYGFRVHISFSVKDLSHFQTLRGIRALRVLMEKFRKAMQTMTRKEGFCCSTVWVFFLCLGPVQLWNNLTAENLVHCSVNGVKGINVVLVKKKKEQLKTGWFFYWLNPPSRTRRTSHPVDFSEETQKKAKHKVVESECPDGLVFLCWCWNLIDFRAEAGLNVTSLFSLTPRCNRTKNMNMDTELRDFSWSEMRLRTSCASFSGYSYTVTIAESEQASKTRKFSVRIIQVFKSCQKEM